MYRYGSLFNTNPSALGKAWKIIKTLQETINYRRFHELNLNQLRTWTFILFLKTWTGKKN